MSDLSCKLTRDFEDKALMLRVQEGDAAALGILFDRYSRLVFRVARRILRGDRAEAQDAVQDVFLYIVRRGCLFDPDRGTVATWVLQVTYSRSFNRRKRYMARLSERHVPMDVAGHIPDPAMGPERMTERIAAGQIVRSALPHLTEAQRETLCLHFFEDYSLLEISIKRNEKLTNTRHHFYRGIENLRRAIIANRQSAPRESDDSDLDVPPVQERPQGLHSHPSRPDRSAARSVEPEPQKGSRTTSPRFENDSISGVSAESGFYVVRSLVPDTSPAEPSAIGSSSS